MSANNHNKKNGLKIHRGHGFKHPTIPFKPTPGLSTAQVLDQMAETSFQARSLGQAFQTWKRAIEDSTTIYLGLSGAMVPAGMREVIFHMIKNRYVDVIVSTGANLFHDIHESLGGTYFKCPPTIDDIQLRKARMDRMYDVVGSDLEFIEVDKFIAHFAQSLPPKPYTTREFFYRLGVRVAQHSQKDGIVTSAAKHGVPIYCPAIGDSSFGIALATWHRGKKSGKGADHSQHFQFDVIRDVYETGRIALESQTTGMVLIGGGTPKNFTQQTWVTAEYMGQPEGGHKYCIQLTTDAPHWGGLSGCTFEESTSWGKIHFEANKVAAYVDATIGLTLLVQGLTDIQAQNLRKSKPTFIQGESLKMIPPGITPRAMKQEKILA
ncbi:MAG: deoxyhypusine synthase family protein [Elusimicrobia bacterium]|nr:deoxyhypusine synthase family protein [Elusimicrobiota bacterium]